MAAEPRRAQNLGYTQGDACMAEGPVLRCNMERGATCRQLNWRGRALHGAKLLQRQHVKRRRMFCGHVPARRPAVREHLVQRSSLCFLSVLSSSLDIKV